MRVLWICNNFLPEYFEAKGLTAGNKGGWMRGLAEALLVANPDLELAVASTRGDISTLETVRTDHYTFYALPKHSGTNAYDSALEPLWLQVRQDFKPDVVHIHGSEFPHGLAWVNACGPQHVVLSLQGIVSGYARYDAGGIKNRKFNTFSHIQRLIPRLEGMNFSKLGRYEEELIGKLHHIIGRTSWDADHTWAINPAATYHFCNENLRAEFYSPAQTWSPQTMQPHRIFLSQAGSPIKGLHKLMDALPLVLREFPDAEVYVGGEDLTRRPGGVKGVLRRLLPVPYYDYILRRLHKEGLGEKIRFTGSLNAEQMIEQYLAANVFVCPSAIENSPNSLGEAQMLGVPTVSAYVGGVPDMVSPGHSGLLYRFEEHEMLARAICRIFANADLAQRLGAAGRQAALERHDRDVNAQRMMEIYQEVWNSTAK